MKLLKTVFSDLALYEDELVMNLAAIQRVSEDAKYYLNEITDKVYTNPIIELAGLNASGKTITMKVFRLALSLLNGEKLNSLRDKELYLELIKDKPIKIKSYYYWDSDFYVLETKIDKKLSGNLLDENLRIIEEVLYKKKKKVKVTKSNWEVDPDAKNSFYHPVLSRKDGGDFLSEDISINVSVINKSGTPITFCDFLDTVNHNFFTIFGDYIPEVLNYLDPNIEYLRTDELKDSKKIKWHLKFKNKSKELVLNSFSDLEFYLSSGTIKGIGLFVMSIVMFIQGGYVLVDELENHFNLKIVETLLEFYLNHKTNKNGATIIFTTHYPELLDIPSRNDAINILTNNGKISCRNLSTLKPRNDGMKNSQAFVQNFLNTETAPSYRSYIALKNAIENVEMAEERQIFKRKDSDEAV